MLYAQQDHSRSKKATGGLVLAKDVLGEPDADGDVQEEVGEREEDRTHGAARGTRGHGNG